MREDGTANYLLVDSSTGEVIAGYEQPPFCAPTHTHGEKKQLSEKFKNNLKKILIVIGIVVSFFLYSFVQVYFEREHYEEGFSDGNEYALANLPESELYSLIYDDIYSISMDKMFDDYLDLKGDSYVLKRLFDSLGAPTILFYLSDFSGKQYVSLDDVDAISSDNSDESSSAFARGYIKGLNEERERNDADWTQFFEDAKLVNPITEEPINSKEDFEKWKLAYYATLNDED